MAIFKLVTEDHEKIVGLLTVRRLASETNERALNVFMAEVQGVPKQGVQFKELLRG